VGALQVQVAGLFLRRGLEKEETKEMGLEERMTWLVSGARTPLD
jgi:hypothetical protein